MALADVGTVRISGLYQKSDANSNAIGLTSCYVPATDTHHLFYYNSNNRLANLHYAGSGPANDTTVQFRDGEGGITISADVEGARPIAAVPFGLSADRIDSVRVYYVENGYVKELYPDGNTGYWIHGEFNALGVKLAKHTGLTATWDIKHGLRVYFFSEKDPDTLTQAYQVGPVWHTVTLN